ncbi:GMC family oxidoreductase [Kineococcus indalonis]|uniref:GMC oxidoreductase n=1 Tax=Kineococcus indalonis TaxID=2696566 RepID=UPI00141273F4|nr:GMC oxidoreductase [Kineococcus indalonis]NAZ87592.1 4Fe-4S ferredoxin [Kineococcus indalonis]
MTTNLVVGSGPAAVGVALRLLAQGDQRVTLVDLGGTLEEAHRDAAQRMGRTGTAGWDAGDVDLVSVQPVAQDGGRLPQKRSFGSDYPFRDLGQLAGVSATGGGNRSVVSSAYGGFSTVWGAQAMPFSRSTFQRWPFGWADMEAHYRAVLGEVPLAAEEDDLAELFPLLGPARPLPPLSERTRRVLAGYERHRSALRRRGVVVGRARLAMRPAECTSCGLCMTGCPYGLVYSASQSVDRWRRRGALTYRGGLLAHRVSQRGEQAHVLAREVGTGRDVELRADRVFLACGGIGTTRLVLASMSAPPAELRMAESVQFTMPFLSRSAVGDPRRAAVPGFTLNQFNVLVDLGDEGYDTSQVHCYPYNPAVLGALPAALRHRAADPLTSRLLRRLTVGLGYLPSWASPGVRVAAAPRTPGALPAVTVSSTGPDGSEAFSRVVRELVRAAPRLDLWPVLPAARLSAAAKSYHFGASFPHAASASATTTDRLGRLPDWDRVHLVDGSVLPSVPSTTFTLTVMANAHRIADEVLRRPGARASGQSGDLAALP